jgi:hypothetical protein
MMPKFLILYASEISAEQQMNASPEDMKKGMEQWIDWYKRQGSAIIDQGNPLGKPFALNKKGVTKAHTHLITGYSIVEAKDIEAVKAMVIDHPHLNQPKSSIEILEIMPMM